MPQKKHKPEEIVAKLRQVDVLLSQGRPVEEAIRSISVTPFTYCRWRREFGGLKRDQVKRLKRNDRSELLALTAEIVAAHVGNNAVAGADVGALIQSVFDTLNGLSTDEAAASVELTPAVPVRRSVTDDHIICLEDGKKLKTLKRHLMSEHGLTPEEYRAKWGLRLDYPMVTSNYSASARRWRSRSASAASRRHHPRRAKRRRKTSG